MPSPTIGGTLSAAQLTESTNSNAEKALLAQNLFPSLLGFAFRGVGFPYTDTKIIVRQDLAIHKFVGVDGADIEPTGMSPIEFSCRIPFLNHIQAGPNETWKSGSLYPQQFRQFWSAMTNRAADYLQHPEFGQFYVVPSHFEVDWTSKTRDGVYVEASWLQTYDPNQGQSNAGNDTGDLSQGVQAGVDLDTLLPKLPASAFPSLPAQTFSYGDFARSLQGVADQISLLQYQTAGKIDAVIAQTQTTLSAFSQATSNPLAANGSVQSWPTRDAADRFISSIADIKRSLLSTGQQVGIYMPAFKTSLVMIAQQLSKPISDLMNLNPSLLSSIVVPAMSKVRYYTGTTSTGI